MVVDKNTPLQEIEDTLKTFIRRDDISIILINQNVAEMVRHILDAHSAPVPAILEIPSKDSPYDPNKDSILRYEITTRIIKILIYLLSQES